MQTTPTTQTTPKQLSLEIIKLRLEIIKLLNPDFKKDIMAQYNPYDLDLALLTLWDEKKVHIKLYIQRAF